MTINDPFELAMSATAYEKLLKEEEDRKKSLELVASLPFPLFEDNNRKEC